MRQIAFVSPLGGSGQTTVLANLATLLARSQTCVAVDLSAQNGLGFHLGLTQAANDGWMSALFHKEWLGQSALRNSDGVGLLPMGALDSTHWLYLQQWLQEHTYSQIQKEAQNAENIAKTEAETESSTSTTTTSIQWLAQQWRALALEANSLLLLDAPTWPSVLATQALSGADLLVITLDVSARSVLLKDVIQNLLNQVNLNNQNNLNNLNYLNNTSDLNHSKITRGVVLLNNFDPRRPTQRQALEQLQEQWSDLLIPYTIHADESCPLALAQFSCVCAYEPQAQSAHDLQGVSQWLISQLKNG